MINIISEGDYKGLFVINENVFSLYYKMMMWILNKILRIFKIVRKYFFKINNKNYYNFLKYFKNFFLVFFVVSFCNLIGCGSFFFLIMGMLLLYYMMDCLCNYVVFCKCKKLVYLFYFSKVNGCIFKVYFVI